MSFSSGDPQFDYINTLSPNTITVTCPLLRPGCVFWEPPISPLPAMMQAKGFSTDGGGSAEFPHVLCSLPEQSSSRKGPGTSTDFLSYWEDLEDLS